MNCSNVIILFVGCTECIPSLVDFDLHCIPSYFTHNCESWLFTPLQSKVTKVNTLAPHFVKEKGASVREEFEYIIFYGYTVKKNSLENVLLRSIFLMYSLTV